MYTIADIPTSHPSTDIIVNNNHLSTTISHYLQLDEIFISPRLRPDQVLLSRHAGDAYTGALLAIECGCMLGTTLLPKIQFDIRQTGRYINHRQNSPLK